MWLLNIRRHSRLLPCYILIMVGGALGNCKDTPPLDTLLSAEQIDLRLADHLRLEPAFDVEEADPNRRLLLAKLSEVARLVERIYWQQVEPTGWEIRERLENSEHPKAAKLLDLVLIHAGPYDRHEGSDVFHGQLPRPAGAGLYPPDLTREEFGRYLDQHPEESDTLQSAYTLVRRQGDRLVAVPYHVAYAEWTEPAAVLLDEAAELTHHPPLARYLRQAAEGFRTDRWEDLDSAWMFEPDNSVVLVIAPYRAPFDTLIRRKAAYQMSVGLKHPELDARARSFLEDLDLFEQKLPLAPRFLRQEVKTDLEFVVVDDFARAGTLARGHREGLHFGGKQVLWRNITAARFEHLFLPKARRVLTTDSLTNVTFRGYYDTVIMHRLAHVLGPDAVPINGESRPLRAVLGKSFGILDEAKAEAVGIQVLSWLQESGRILPEVEREHQASYLAHVFLFIHHTSLPGTPERWLDAGILTVRWHQRHGALSHDPETGLWTIDHDRVPSSVEALSREILEIFATGDVDRASRLLADYGQMTEEIQSTLDRLSEVRPLWVEPIFPDRWN